MATTINLSELKSNYIDLSGATDAVRVVGSWKGDRLVFKGHNGKRILLDGCRIESSRTEDDKNAIAFQGGADNMHLTGINDALITYGGIAFWGPLTNVSLAGLEIYYANIAIHAAQDVQHQNVNISNCRIRYPMREGIYIGPHTKQEKPSTHVVIENNYLEGCGWDAIQLNARYSAIRKNEIVGAGLAREKWQNYAVTIQPGSLVYYHGNTVRGAANRVQVLDSRFFETENYKL